MKLKLTVLCACATALTSSAITHRLEFFEHSSTSLVVTYDGTALPVVPNGLEDHWLVKLPDYISQWGRAQSIYWYEPDSHARVDDPAARFNEISGAPGFPYWLPPSTLRVDSDTVFNRFGQESGYSDIHPDGFVRSGFLYDLRGGLPGSPGYSPIDIVFHDFGDSRSVPDAGSGFAMFSLGTLSLMLLNRRPGRFFVQESCEPV